MEDRVRINQRLTDLEHNVRRLLSNAGMSWEEGQMASGLGPDVIEVSRTAEVRLDLHNLLSVDK